MLVEVVVNRKRYVKGKKLELPAKEAQALIASGIAKAVEAKKEVKLEKVKVIKDKKGK